MEMRVVKQMQRLHHSLIKAPLKPRLLHGYMGLEEAQEGSGSYGEILTLHGGDLCERSFDPPVIRKAATEPHATSSVGYMYR